MLPNPVTFCVTSRQGLVAPSSLGPPFKNCLGKPIRGPLLLPCGQSDRLLGLASNAQRQAGIQFFFSVHAYDMEGKRSAFN
jgi:hypothetical protein